MNSGLLAVPQGAFLATILRACVVTSFSSGQNPIYMFNLRALRVLRGNAFLAFLPTSERLAFGFSLYLCGEILLRFQPQQISR
jgi:hypothetical protein